MATDALGIVVHDLAAHVVPVVRLVGTLADAHLAVDTQVLVAVDAELVEAFADGLKEHLGHLAGGWFRKSSRGTASTPIL
jgi:hypothetical protein